MEMYYEGALVMPSSYSVMDDEEMTYVEGGGTVKFIASTKTMKIIANATATTLGTAIGGMFSAASGQWWTVAFAASVSGALCAAITNCVMNLSGGYRAFNYSWTTSLVEGNKTINIDELVNLFY